jgi:hypothetical protein
VSTVSLVICQRPSSPLAHLRSTVILSGVSIVRARGLYDRYAAHLEPSVRQAIEEAIAGTWLPTTVAMGHFAAIDSLGLSTDEAFEIGASSGERFGATLWGTLVRVAKASGADPWVALRSYHRIFGRAVDGGAFVVRELGPKDATIELLSVPFSRHAYFRGACRGAHARLFGFLAAKIYVREVPRSAHDNGFIMRISWV